MGAFCAKPRRLDLIVRTRERLQRVLSKKAIYQIISSEKIRIATSFRMVWRKERLEGKRI